jgi:hypothetical protein
MSFDWEEGKKECEGKSRKGICGWIDGWIYGWTVGWMDI